VAARPFNFAPGPAVLPDAVLERAAAEMMDLGGSGMSVMEMSHRGAQFESLHQAAIDRFKRLLKLPSSHSILFMQGGATAQNAILPLNLLAQNSRCDYVHTGHWSAKSIQEAQAFGDVHLAASAEQARAAAQNGSSEDWPSFGYVPPLSEWQVRADTAYLHICGNETIGGVEYAEFPHLASLGAPEVPLVVDMSSHVLSKAMDFSTIALAYGGAQKNIGPSGLTFVILNHELLLDRFPVAMGHCPSVFDYRKVLEQNSLLNTPSTFAIYMAGLVFEWLENQGGVEAMESQNAQKAACLYGALDASSFYETRVAKAARSRMNVPFYLPDERLYPLFLEQSKAAGLLNLKGHKAVGGLRASLYNAMPLEGVEALVRFMQAFEQEHA
jgi:phosphoserine aminotransferase